MARRESNQMAMGAGLQGIKPVIKTTSMPAEMQDTAIEFTLLSINEKNTEQDTATAIKQKIETKYPGV
jgi:hypothetical protein